MYVCTSRVFYACNSHSLLVNITFIYLVSYGDSPLCFRMLENFQSFLVFRVEFLVVFTKWHREHVRQFFANAFRKETRKWFILIAYFLFISLLEKSQFYFVKCKVSAYLHIKNQITRTTNQFDERRVFSLWHKCKILLTHVMCACTSVHSSRLPYGAFIDDARCNFCVHKHLKYSLVHFHHHNSQ